MSDRSKKASHEAAGDRPLAPDPAAQIVPLVREIHAAVGDLRSRFESAIADLNGRLEGKTKSHYTVEEAATLCGRAPYTVRHWVKTGLLRATRVQGTGPKGRLLIPRAEIQKLVDAGRAGKVPAVATD